MHDSHGLQGTCEETVQPSSAAAAKAALQAAHLPLGYRLLLCSSGHLSTRRGASLQACKRLGVYMKGIWRQKSWGQTLGSAGDEMRLTWCQELLQTNKLLEQSMT